MYYAMSEAKVCSAEANLVILFTFWTIWKKTAKSLNIQNQLNINIYCIY